MRTTPEDRIREFTEAGWWSTTTTGELFDRNVAEVGDRVAVVDQPNRPDLVAGDRLSLTYTELGDRADRLAARLAGAGIERGDVVVTQFPNIVEQVVAYMALIRLQAIISPVPVQYGRHELGGIAAETQARAWLTVGTLRGEDFVSPRRAAFGDDVLVGLVGGGDGFDLGDLDPSDDDRAALGRVTEVAADANDVLTVCWTSGTTGEPKGVPRSHNHWLSIGRAVASASGIQDGDGMLNPFPFVNMASFGGFFVPWLLERARLELHHPFDMQVFLAQLSSGVAYTIAPPAVLTMLLARPEVLAQVDLSAVRAIGSGSAPLPPSMVVGWQEQYGLPIINNFGSNEGVSLVSNATDVPDPVKRATYFPRFGVEGLEWSNPVASQMRSKLLDLETDAEVTAPGHPGELVIWGPTVFDGYLGDDGDRARVFTEDGFFRTGDVFEIAEEDDRLYHFVGRTKDIINRGGMKISAAELEGLLVGHPAITEAAVTAYPDDVMGERAAAIVVPAEGQSVTVEELAEWLTDQGVARFKCPERLQVVQALPRNPLGKVVRPELAGLLDS